MYRRISILSSVAFLFLALAGCGSEDEAAAEAKASDFSGDWSGTYALSGAQSAETVPFDFFNVTGVDDSGMVVGTLESEHVTGAFYGTLDASGVVVGEVDNEVDATIWMATVAKTDAGISLDLNTDALSVAGEGTPSAPANGLSYKTTITNKTDQTVKGVALWTRCFSIMEGIKLCPISHAPPLAPGESYTFETELHCPLGLTKNFNADNKRSFPDTSCQGKVKDTEDWLWCCCRNSSWEIRPEPILVNGIYPYPNTLVRL
jgi:hypothetical protein